MIGHEQDLKLLTTVTPGATSTVPPSQPHMPCTTTPVQPARSNGSATQSCRSDIHHGVSDRLQERHTLPLSVTSHDSASDPQIQIADSIYHHNDYGESLYNAPIHCHDSSLVPAPHLTTNSA
eukprot:1741720-Amphidinium_carterae.3